MRCCAATTRPNSRTASKRWAAKRFSTSRIQPWAFGPTANGSSKRNRLARAARSACPSRRAAAGSVGMPCQAQIRMPQDTAMCHRMAGGGCQRTGGHAALPDDGTKDRRLASGHGVGGGGGCSEIHHRALNGPEGSMECAVKARFAGFGFLRHGACRGWQSQRWLPYRKLLLAGSKDGGQVYTDQDAGVPNGNSGLSLLPVAGVKGRLTCDVEYC